MDLLSALRENQESMNASGETGQTALKVDLLKHLAELRRRIIIILCWFLGFFCVAAFYANPVISYLSAPLLAALPGQGSARLYYTGPFDVFSAQVKVSFLLALVLVSPLLFYHLWRFAAPRLPFRQRRRALPFATLFCLLFLIGVLFCYYLMMPAMLRFLIDLGAQVGTPLITVNDYLGMLLKMLFAFGMFFETPLVLVLLGLMGIITADQLAHHRRVVIVLILILSAVFTSPDPITQIALAIPTYLLYEAAIVAIRMLTAEQPKDQAKPAQKISV